MSATILTLALLGVIVLIKLILWLIVKPSERGNFFSSFFTFFSIHDRYDVNSKSLKKFMKYNNIINVITYGIIAVFIVIYLLSTDDVNGLIPTKKEAKEYKRGRVDQ